MCWALGLGFMGDALKCGVLGPVSGVVLLAWCFLGVGWGGGAPVFLQCGGQFGGRHNAGPYVFLPHSALVCAVPVTRVPVSKSQPF